MTSPQCNININTNVPVAVSQQVKALDGERELVAMTSPKIHVQSRAQEASGPCIYMDGAVLNEAVLRSFKRLNPPAAGHEAVVFFDLDNTLYAQSTGIAEEMGHRIQLYFQQHLHLPADESAVLGRRFYRDYGLAIKGIIRNFQIDAAHYDAFVDGGLQLEQVLKPDADLDRMLASIRARRWILTNAGLSHALRVLSLLQITRHFEGIVYCDYSEPDFPAKPDRLAYERAMLCAGVTDPQLCYFVDDNVENVRTATELGWTAVHYDENPDPSKRQSGRHIGRLLDLPTALPELFQPRKDGGR